MYTLENGSDPHWDPNFEGVTDVDPRFGCFNPWIGTRIYFKSTCKQATVAPLHTTLGTKYYTHQYKNGHLGNQID